MAALSTRLSDLTTRIATECKSLRILVNGNTSNLSSLTTTNKTNLVNALNEVKALADGLAAAGFVTINDASSASATQTWSLNKIQSHVSTAINAVLSGAPTALDTLNELAAAIGNDANFASSITTALGNRVRADAAQAFTDPQKAQARTNIGAAEAAAIGNTDTDFVAVFNTALA
jgi:hypothetical protein